MRPWINSAASAFWLICTSIIVCLLVAASYCDKGATCALVGYVSGYVSKSVSFLKHNPLRDSALQNQIGFSVYRYYAGLKPVVNELRQKSE